MEIGYLFTNDQEYLNTKTSLIPVIYLDLKYLRDKKRLMENQLIPRRYL